MQKDKLKELIKQCLSSVLDEESASGDAGGYLGIKAFKPKYEGANTVFNRNPARPKTSQDTNSPAGFESMPDSGKVYIKSGFKVVKPEERIDAKDLWKGNHLEERIAVLVPQAFRKPKKQHETSKSGHEDLPNPDKYFELVKFKIVDPKEEPLNEGVDMGELQDTLKRVKKENPGKKVGYTFTKDVPKGYKISIDSKYVNEGNHTAVNFKPYTVRDANNPNFLKVFISYPEGVGHLAAYGQTTMSGQEREYGAKKAMEIGKAIAAKLEVNYDLEDIDVTDNENGKVVVFAVSDDFINMPKPSINEVRYSKFKSEAKTRTPQEQLHMGVKEMQRKLDEINRLVDFTTRMKTELKGDAEEMNLLKRTHNSLFKINEKIQEINDKIKGLTT